MTEDAAASLWRRILSDESDMMSVYTEVMLPKMKTLTESRMARLELLGDAVKTDFAWREIERGTGLTYRFDRSATDCQCLFVPRWPVDPRRFAWWRTMCGLGGYFFRPEESPIAKYRTLESDGVLSVDTPAGADTWVYLPSKRVCPTTYALEFDYTTHQAMAETLQLCFAFDSLADRMRFVLNDNRSLGFEVVKDGLFLAARNKDLWGRFRRPCSIALARPVRVRLEVMEDVFQLFFDGVPAMSVRLKDCTPHPARWAFIAWNGAEASVPMRIEIANPRVYVRADAS